MRDAPQMNLRPAAAGLSVIALFFLTATAPGQTATEPYPEMAPLAPRQGNTLVGSLKTWHNPPQTPQIR